MTTLAFVIWMIGWPVSCRRPIMLSKECEPEHAEKVRQFTGLYHFTIWVVVGVMLWLNR